MTVRVITIDGPSGSGKGTVGQRLADRLGWNFLDSGAIYRALGLAAEARRLSIDDESALEKLARGLDLSFSAGRVWLDARDVTEDLRTERVGNLASKLAVIPIVRAALLQRQRAYACAPGLVADGRDMGSVVFPQAQLKIFLTASARERARRRYKQLSEKGFDGNVENLAAEIEERDRRDAERAVAPLKAPNGAIAVDSTGLRIDEVDALVLGEVEKAFPELALQK